MLWASFSLLCVGWNALSTDGSFAIALRKAQHKVAFNSPSLTKPFRIGPRSPHVRSAAHLSNDNAAKALEDAELCIKANDSWAKGFTRKGAALHKLKR